MTSVFSKGGDFDPGSHKKDDVKMKAVSEMTVEIKTYSRLTASYWHLKMRYRREISLS